MKSKKFWSYDLSQSHELRQENLDVYKSKGRIYDDINTLFDMMGMTAHPGLKPAKEYSEPTVFSFENIYVDINTLKILFTILPISKVTTLKFNRNVFNFKNLEFLIENVLKGKNNVYSFILEWNNKVRYDDYLLDLDETVNELNNSTNEQDQANLFKIKTTICKLATSPKIEALCLRGNNLGDEAAKIIFEHLKTNTTLRILNLYLNNLTTKSMESFCQLLTVNKKIEDVNFGRNYLNDSDLALLKEYIGKIPMSNEDVENHNKKLKERDAIIERNKKLKIMKKPEEPLPVIPDVENIEGQFYIIKNTKLRNLNFIQNNFTGECLNTLSYILETNQELNIAFDEKIFERQDREKLKSKYSVRLYLTK
jgi:hypothetical protein